MKKGCTMFYIVGVKSRPMLVNFTDRYSNSTIFNERTTRPQHVLSSDIKQNQVSVMSRTGKDYLSSVIDFLRVQAPSCWNFVNFDQHAWPSSWQTVFSSVVNFSGNICSSNIATLLCDPISAQDNSNIFLQKSFIIFVFQHLKIAIC